MACAMGEASGDRMIGCTTVSGNYMPFARVLADSWAEHHPGMPFVVLVIDADDGPRAVDGPFTTVTPFDIGLDAREVRTRAAMYDPVEFSTSMKPAFMRHLLERGEGPVLFIDPDAAVYAPLTGVGELADRHGTVLTTHAVDPIPRDGMGPSEIDLAVSGVYNTGFVAVGKGGRAFLDWWGERLHRDCIFDPDRGLFVDQRWVEWVPSYFPHHVLRDPGVNAAHWNLHDRPLTWTGTAFEVAGEPLRMFHFSGFDPMNPTVLASYRYSGPLRADLSTHPALRRLHEGYAELLLAAGFADAALGGYRFARAADGTPLDRWVRRMLRNRVLMAERGQGPPPPDPFDPEQIHAFHALVTSSEAVDALPPRLRATVQLSRARALLEGSRKPPSHRMRRVRFHLERLPRRVALLRADRRDAVIASLLETIDGLERRLDGEVRDLRAQLERLERDGSAGGR